MYAIFYPLNTLLVAVVYREGRGNSFFELMQYNSIISKEGLPTMQSPDKEIIPKPPQLQSGVIAKLKLILLPNFLST